MASQDALLEHIVTRMRADIDFLVSQNVISPADGRAMTDKLPGHQAPTAMPTPVSSPSFTPPLSVGRRDVPPPPVRSASQAPQARSLWAYNADGQETDDLSFGVGETIEIIEEVNADWWRGKNARGQTGLFPSNYVEKILNAATPVYSPPPGPPAGMRMVAPPFNEKSSYDPMANPPPQPQQGQDQQAAPPKKNKFGKYGGTMAQSAAGGVGFGAGAAVGSGIINAIF